MTFIYNRLGLCRWVAFTLVQNVSHTARLGWISDIIYKQINIQIKFDVRDREKSESPKSNLNHIFFLN